VRSVHFPQSQDRALTCLCASGQRSLGGGQLFESVAMERQEPGTGSARLLAGHYWDVLSWVQLTQTPGSANLSPCRRLASASSRASA